MDLFARWTFIHLTELSIILKNVTSVVTLHFLICFFFIIFFTCNQTQKVAFSSIQNLTCIFFYLNIWDTLMSYLWESNFAANDETAHRFHRRSSLCGRNSSDPSRPNGVTATLHILFLWLRLWRSSGEEASWAAPHWCSVCWDKTRSKVKAHSPSFFTWNVRL